MAKKVNPRIFRVGINEKWLSDWFVPHYQMAKFIHQDRQIREIIYKMCKPAGVDKIVISRDSNNVLVEVYVGKPGIAIGRGGVGIEKMEDAITKKLGIKAKISVIEVKQPYLSAALVAQSVEESMLRRVPLKIILKQLIERIEASGALGARIQVAGIGPIKQARVEKIEMKGGKVPLTTIRARIDYAYTKVLVERMYGIKVWIYKGE